MNSKGTSFFAWAICTFFLVAIRLSYPGSEQPLNVTGWDSFGYYMYLPGIVIHQDMAKLEWVPEMDAKYGMTGGELYQAKPAKNGNYVTKYLGGVAIMQGPFFLTAHALAKPLGYPADGFSPPYQFAIAFAGLLYAILGLWILRAILRRYFTENITALTLLLVALATNLVQYSSVENGMSHTYIFFLYALVLWAVLKWHEHPSIKWAAVIGFVCGLAVISRPTEIIIVFIPILWGMHNQEASREKWQLVRRHLPHIAVMSVLGIIAILPQIIYWKIVAGTFLHNVGSRWYFLNPWFRVLVGFEKGWFIYTPVTILFVAGFFFLKKYPFQKAVITFCLLNLWIITAWSDWHYGASYSTRALVQSYPVFALSLAGFLTWAFTKRWKIAVYVVAAYFCLVNIFQIYQYNAGIIDNYEMNARYYSAIYLDPNPSGLDMSYRYTSEVLKNPQSHTTTILFQQDTMSILALAPYERVIFFDDTLRDLSGENWLHLTSELNIQEGLYCGYFFARAAEGDSVKPLEIKLGNGVCKPGKDCEFEFFFQIPTQFTKPRVEVFFEGCQELKGVLGKTMVWLHRKKE